MYPTIWDPVIQCQALIMPANMSLTMAREAKCKLAMSNPELPGSKREFFMLVWLAKDWWVALFTPDPIEPAMYSRGKWFVLDLLGWVKRASFRHILWPRMASHGITLCSKDWLPWVCKRFSSDPISLERIWKRACFPFDVRVREYVTLLTHFLSSTETLGH